MTFTEALTANLNNSNELGCICFELTGNGLFETARFGKSHEPTIIILDASDNRDTLMYMVQQYNKVGWDMQGEADGIEWSDQVIVQQIKLSDFNDQKKDFDYKEVGPAFAVKFTHTT